MRTAAIVMSAAALFVPLARAASCVPTLRDVRLVSRTAIWTAKTIHLGEGADAGMAILPRCSLAQGTIELDLHGRDVLQKSFVGVAFHVAGESAYEAVYFRPFNFQHPDAVRRTHAVQYIAEPGFGWKKLRQEHPGAYEAPIQPLVAADAWFHARVVVTESRVTVFVNGSSEPALSVERLASPDGNAVALWVGSDSDGEFGNVRVTPAE